MSINLSYVLTVPIPGVPIDCSALSASSFMSPHILYGSLSLYDGACTLAVDWNMSLISLHSGTSTIE